MAELAALKAQRGILKRRLTGLGNYLKNFDQGDSIIQLKSRQTVAEGIYKEFCEIQASIEIEEDIADNFEYRETFDNQYFDLISDMSNVLENPVVLLSNNIPETSTNNPNSKIQVKLPTLNLPEFSGSFTEWQSFIDIFKSLIHTNASLSEAQRFHYLRSCLKGDALRAIESLNISSANYSAAIKILEKRYDNKRLITQEHVRNIFKISTINKSNHLALRQMIDTLNSNLNALEVLEQPINQWDAMLVPLITEKLDYASNKEWQSKLNSNIPTVNELIDFLESRCQFLESLNSESKNFASSKPQFNTQTQSQKYKPRNYVANHLITKKTYCLLCKRDDHFIFQCPEFQKLNVEDRIKQSIKLNLCKNCLRNNHVTANCKSMYNCRKCHKTHNTLLHRVVNENNDKSTSQFEINNVNTEPINSNTEVVASTSSYHSTNNEKHVLLSTAIIQIKGKNGDIHDCRALLDVGSQSNFISKALCDKLKLKLKPVYFNISGLNQSANQVNTMTNVRLNSKYNNYSTNLDCLVVPQITSNLPQQDIPLKSIKIPEGIILADPNFYNSGPIDVLIGAERFWELLCVGQVHTEPLQPYFQKTQLGWIAGGNIKQITTDKNLYCHFVTNIDLNKRLEKFWEIENFEHSVDTTNILDNPCERQFITNHKRDETGRFVVPLLKKDNCINLGNSKDVALKRFYNLERKLNANPVTKAQYCQFMQEYLSLNHMELVDESEIDNNVDCCYLPHHAVVKESSITTKLRVVFDASAKSSNNLSLNDNLLAGPTLQQELVSILTRFRTHTFVFTADISKMYRQIKIDPDDTNYQRIFWRQNENEQLKTYKLTTVTYGTTCAPFLAVRCLQELAYQYQNDNPQATSIILRDFYMDDLLTGCDTLDDAIKLRNDITQILNTGGFQLCKLATNNSKILPEVEQGTSELPLINFDKNGNTKTLGLIWNCHTDVFRYEIEIPISSLKPTKRIILSIISKIFDPLGLISPVILISKLIMQQLWSSKSTWDESVSMEIYSIWRNYIGQLHNLNQLEIPRSVLIPARQNVEIHGFCDASEKAYGAVIYLKSINQSNEIKINILCSKSRVAPLKKISLPRLELCGAQLLANLATRILETLNITISRRYFWTDSTIVLAWLSSDSGNWKTFVANRVGQIQTITKSDEWFHVKSKDNPADIISRGMLPSELINSHLWWHGPKFLSESVFEPTQYNEINNSHLPDSNFLEKRNPVVLMTVIDIEFMNKYSSYSKLERIVAYILRFLNNCKRPNKKRTGPLQVKELNDASIKIIQVVQGREFYRELKTLKSIQQVDKQSILLSLNPFVDNNNLIRAGGRLSNNQLINYDKRFPIILPKGHHVTKLIIKKFHIQNLHSGLEATLAAVRQLYWPISGRSVTRQILHQCINCFKINPVKYQQKMGDLPSFRSEQLRPFIKSGVDYCGPILIREGRGRGKKSIKVYIALFICLVTKAVHIELVGDLTTDSFLNAFRRFVSRRGTVTHLFSDNATNFVGAKRRLNELSNFFENSDFINNVIEPLATERVHWSFIPPRSPNFGGIWESNIKSMKNHLKRVIGNALLTYEEMYTLLTRIEACLNSRPLTPLSSDPNDVLALTPGHFLIGETLTAPAEPDLQEIQENRLSRWQLIEKLRQHFWRRWSREYLTQLQGRSKWRTEAAVVLQEGTMVIMVDDNLPPLQWPLGRIVQLHPGNDNLVRVVTVRTNKGLFKRSVNKICVLPTDTTK